MMKLVDSKELAKILGISLRTLDSLDKRRELPEGIRVGHVRRWRMSDIDDWINIKLELARAGSAASEFKQN